MKSMTIHGIDSQLAELIKSKAESEGLSINKTIKKILETALGVKPQPPHQNMDEFREFCGVWTDDELKAFEENTSAIRVVDSEDWQ
jgi:hypothetical protein